METIFESNTNYKILIDYHDFKNSDEKKYFEKGGKMITELSFSPTAFLTDIMTCGMPQFNLGEKVSSRRTEEINYKIFLMKTALEIDDDGYVTISDNIKYLDSSERNFISYYVGIFITKLISREIFGYDYLVHYKIVDRYKEIARDKKSRKEPDLIAFYRKSDAYSIFEAKGRKIVKDNLVNSAKEQIKTVYYINGLVPELGVVSIANPIKEGERLRCSMYDPELEGKDGVEITKGELIYLYYSPIFELIRENANNESNCTLELKMEKCSIQCNIEMDKEVFSYYGQFSDMIKKSKKECNGEWEKIIERLPDSREIVTITAEWKCD